MISCDDAHRLIARRSDGTQDDAAAQSQLDAHIDRCADCRAALADQRLVTAILHSRPVQQPSPEFATQLAARLDDASGWFGIADWKRWTFRLAPIAAVLAMVAVFTSGRTTSQRSTITLDEWTANSGSSSSAASILLQDVSADYLLERMLRESTSTAAGERDVR